MYSIRFYRIFDIGEEIDLGELEEGLAANMTTSRFRFQRVNPTSIMIDQPPLLIRLPGMTVDTVRGTLPLKAMARIYEFGAFSLCLSLEEMDAPPSVLQEMALSFSGHDRLGHLFDAALAELRSILSVHIGSRPVDPEFYDDYTIYLTDRDDPSLDPVAVLLGERGEFSPEIRRETLQHSFSYYPNEKAIISWGGALIISPEPPVDLIELIEFAAVQVLELRFYDRELSRQMDRMYEDIENADRQWWIIRSLHYRTLMKVLMSEQAEVSEILEDINNLIKVTDDIYYARVYAAALQALRSDSWSQSVNRKLSIIRETYRMLSDEVNVQHAHFLEWIIILLIALEIIIFTWPFTGH
ncbi:MAG: hypothetical protein QXL43_02250 [Methanolinea sp.]